MVVAMVGLSFAAVPLYRLYCQVTGYQGTTQRGREGIRRVIDRVRHGALRRQRRRRLPWKFEPATVFKVEVKVGENTLAFYRATNISDRPADRDGGVQRDARLSASTSTR